ncbi:saccharopine dehydrogenase family protein [Aeromicrobium alkaliterrae]|uniref:Saccharopine dehydrogenase NADP-binding domain-containing protein n=1 Tax=Aeromicrobium alkaliterrae TaxID=302168 RepID=A0ABP4VWQ3_9ACTN
MVTDITLLGATGYTGGLTADYLGATLPSGASWAVAGRSRAKLEAVADRIEAAGGVRPEIVTADVTDDASLAAVAEGTRVLVTTVGPYLKHGEPAVKAAAQAGIAYLDLTGEPQFVDDMWLKHHATASESGARLVHAAGFDSIPYDLGVLYTVQQLPDDVPITVNAYLRAGISPSGGTFHSAIGQFSSFRESAKLAKKRRSAEQRPVDRKVRGAGSIGRAPHDTGWAVPLPTIDPQIVLRSARALPTYGPEFTYGHFAHVRTTRMLAAGAVGVGALAVTSQIPPLRKLLLSRMDPGDGPDAEKREKAWFKLDILADAGDDTLHTRVTGKDPGYGGTAKYLGEAAMSLAFDDLPQVSGQTTTAVAMGQALIDRLNPEAMKFQTCEEHHTDPH